VLFGLIPAVGLVGVILYLLAHPEKVEKWGSILYRILSVLPIIFRGARRQYVRLDVQGRINDFTRTVGTDAPYLAEQRVQVQWVEPNVDRKAFLREGKVVIRLRAVDPDDMNFVRGAYMFVSTSLLYKAKRYLARSHRDSIDLFVTTKLLEREKARVVSLFLDEYLHPKTKDVDSKITKYFDTYERMRRSGVFYAIFLQELQFLGDKVFGQRKDEAIIKEVHSLIEFLDRIAMRTVGTEMDLEFFGSYCRFAIVIVGRPFNITPGGEVWTNYVQTKLRPHEVETLYLVCPKENESTVNSIGDALSGDFEQYRKRHTKVRLFRQDGTTFEVEQCLMVLRKRNLAVFQPSARPPSP